MTPVVGAVLEAWGEVRVHRARVVLSLVGVVLAVFAMTIITAAGAIAQQVVLESGERSSGRSTTLNVYAYGQDGFADPARITAAYADLVDRFGVEYSSTVMQTGLQAGAPETGEYLDVMMVETDYGVIHRIDPFAGRWLTDQDRDRLAPAAVVNRTLLERTGMAGRLPPFALPLGTTGTSVTVVGVVDRNPYSGQAYVLAETAERLGALVQPGGVPGLELWVPPDLADRIIAEVPAVLAAQGLQGEASPTSDPGLPGLISKGRWAVRGLSLFALALGTIGVLNVGIVTVRQRIREIGVRRALGASSGRVFAAVVLESVCATALAGLVGVAAAVALVVNLPLESLLREADITDVPAFPFSAAFEAFVAAVAVGALAGLVPATIAVRSKVIDAIRY
ncbi:MAG TPA: FtsX-like permease family protein [Mycobacteriales bacterium]|nr:FtsX-like permease family protein [Mycobacteriales bacterium]